MYEDRFNAFLRSGDTLQVYEGERLVFSSDKDRLLPLLEYIGQSAVSPRAVLIFDKITGNAAALLSVKAGGRQVFSPMGSQLAVETLDKHGVKHHLTEIVPYIERADGAGMCPMEKLSLGKGPEDFYQEMKNIINRSETGAAERKERSWKK